MVKKVFISYARTDEKHIDRVLQISSTLMKDHGIEVVLDLWDCKEGDDLNLFMERIVNDPSIDYVIIVSDTNYKERANSRAGGVGKESTIISSEIYNEFSDSKFIPVFTEIHNSRPSLPTFCDTRNSIDMTNVEFDFEKIEEIGRRVHNKPKYKKPELGSVPDYDNDGTELKQLLNKLRSSQPYNNLDNMNELVVHITEKILYVDDNESQIIDASFLKIKPFLEAWKTFVSYAIHIDVDLSMIAVNFYNNVLSKLNNERERPLTRLFIYFSFLELTIVLIQNNKYGILKDMIYGNYIFLNRETDFKILSLYPRKIESFPQFDNKNIRRHVCDLLYTEDIVPFIEDTDVILNTTSVINPDFKESFSYWHGSLLMTTFRSPINNRSNRIIDKFRSKDYFEQYRFLFKIELDQFKEELQEMHSMRDNYPIISDFINIERIGQY